MSEKKGIVLGIYASYIHFFASLILSFVLTPIILRYLGQAAYGLWAAFGSIMGYFSLLSFGMNPATIKYTAEYRARNEQEGLSRLISTILVIFVLIGVVIILVCVGLAPFIPRLLHIPQDLASAGQMAFLIMGLNLVLTLLGGVFGNIIYGHERVDVLKAFGLVQVVANAAFTVLFLRLGFGLVGVVVAPLLSVLMQIILCLFFISRSNYGIVIHPRLTDIATFRKIAPYSIRSFFLNLTCMILYNTDTIVIGIFLGVSLVTPYAIAYRLCFLMTYIFAIITQAIFPTFSKLYALDDIDRLRYLYLKTTKISLAIWTPLALFLAFYGRSFINLWVGKENFVGMNVFWIFILMGFLHAFGGPTGILLQAIGENKKFMYSEMVNAGLNLLLSVILVMKIGLLGVALGTLLAHLCTSFWFVPPQACKYTRLPIKRYLLSGVLPPLLAGIPAGMIMGFFTRNLLPATNFFNLGLLGILTVVIYSIIYLIFCTTQEERHMYVSLLPRFLESKLSV